jgi:hypothetical protein
VKIDKNIHAFRTKLSLKNFQSKFFLLLASSTAYTLKFYITILFAFCFKTVITINQIYQRYITFPIMKVIIVILKIGMTYNIFQEYDQFPFKHNETQLCLLTWNRNERTNKYVYEVKYKIIICNMFNYRRTFHDIYYISFQVLFTTYSPFCMRQLKCCSIRLPKHVSNIDRNYMQFIRYR